MVNFLHTCLNVNFPILGIYFFVVIWCYALWTLFGGLTIQLPNKSHTVLFLFTNGLSLAYFVSGFLNLHDPVYPLAFVFFLFFYFFKSYSMDCCVAGWRVPDVLLLLEMLLWTPSPSSLLYILSARQSRLSFLLPHYWPFRYWLDVQVFKTGKLSQLHRVKQMQFKQK